MDFEEFSQPYAHLPARPLPKKRLTIDIDEINDFEQQAPHPQKPAEGAAGQGQGRREEQGREERQGPQAVEWLRLREQAEGQRARIEAL